MAYKAVLIDDIKIRVFPLNIPLNGKIWGSNLRELLMMEEAVKS